jgi:transposase
LPPYSPKLNVIERLWKWMRQRATHNRLYESLSELKSGVAAAVRYLQRVPGRVSRLIGRWPESVAQDQTVSGGL